MRWAALCFCLALAGCLRVDIDRCGDDPPHPECALLDGGGDGAIADSALRDGGTVDGGHQDGAVDGGAPGDASPDASRDAE